MILTVAQVAGACRSTPEAVAVAWPTLTDALAQYAVDDGPTEVAVAATVAVETAYTFRPIEERWPHGQTPEQYFARYAPPRPVAAHLGNRSIEDAVLYRGRGYVQLTGRDNYLRYGLRVDVPLGETPERLLDPTVSAAVLACYAADHHLPALAEAGNWEGVRRAVNGGLNGYPEFKAIVDVLLTHLP